MSSPSKSVLHCIVEKIESANSTLKKQLNSVCYFDNFQYTNFFSVNTQNPTEWNWDTAKDVVGTYGWR